ncbi:hypothetical protein [Pseudohaliea rubra]|uniref:hypothetical protein n=1 Tax=Pseudohaliea rubra TaxID=475795 RepID=UPI0011851645|nr:hypothetical protein [Pseudohaliea rubra]
MKGESYQSALTEAETGNVDQDLWVKALTLHYGDTEKAKYEYVKLRVESISSRDSDRVEVAPLTVESSNDWVLHAFALVGVIAIVHAVWNRDASTGFNFGASFGIVLLVAVFALFFAGIWYLLKLSRQNFAELYRRAFSIVAIINGALVFLGTVAK